MKRIVSTFKKKWSEYLLEVIVITIGILGAFALSSWNEQMKLGNKEKDLLAELKISLKTSEAELDDIIESNQESLKLLSSLQKANDEDLPYSVDMDLAFAKITNWTSPFLKSTAYENLKNVGLDIISDPTLKENLIQIFEYEFPYLIDDYDRTEWNMAENVTFPYFVKRIRQISRSEARPHNYEELMNDPEFANILSRLITTRSYGIKLCSETREKVKSIIASM